MNSLEEMLKNTKFVIEATSEAVYLLWEKFSNEAMYKTPNNKYTWKQHYVGYSVVVGNFHDNPINVHCWFYEIDGVLVMFCEGISLVIHHGMINKWLDENCSPRYDNNTRLARTNAANFHNVLHYIDEQNSEKIKLNKKRTDVHTRHCCKFCGCKYGDEDCSVITGHSEQEHSCGEQYTCGFN